jgi:hypothetical protein
MSVSQILPRSVRILTVPALPDVPQVLRCRLLWSDDTDPAATTTFFVRYTGSAPSSATCVTLATDFAGFWANNLNLFDTTTELSGCEVTDLTSPTSGQGLATTTYAGTEGGEQLSGGTCVVVNYAIARRYRGGKPRMYLPWGTGLALESRQAWTGDFLTAVLAAVQAAWTGIIGTEVAGCTISDHVNVSYYSGFTVSDPGGGKRARNVPTLRTTPLVDTVTGNSVLSRPGSQRRRNKV